MGSVTLFGHNSTRPGVKPDEWYGVQKWRTTRRDALDDMERQVRADRRLGVPPTGHRIESITIDPSEITRLREQLRVAREGLEKCGHPSRYHAPCIVCGEKMIESGCYIARTTLARIDAKEPPHAD